MTTTLESTLSSIIQASSDFADQPEALVSYLDKIAELKTATLEAVKEQQASEVESLSAEVRLGLWTSSQSDMERYGGQDWHDYFNCLPRWNEDVAIHQLLLEVFVLVQEMPPGQQKDWVLEPLQKALAILPDFDPRWSSGTAGKGKPIM